MIRTLVLLAALIATAADARVGAIDATFGGSGSTRFAASLLGHVERIRELPDERLVVAGWTVYASVEKSSVARLLADGEIDSTFGAFGVATTIVGGDSRFYDVIGYPDGSAVAVGYAKAAGGPDWLLQRFDASGQLDPTFGVGGTRTTALDGYDRAWRIARQSDGRLLVFGETCAVIPACDVIIARYDANGTLDPTFGTGGLVRTMLHASAYKAGPNLDLAVQSDGRLVLTNGGVMRFLPNGDPDPSFAGGTAIGIQFTHTHGVAVLADGKILVSMENDADLPRGLARFLPNGSLDTSFGKDGFGLGGSQGLGVASDGSIVTTEDAAPCPLRSDDADYDCGMPIFRSRSDGNVDTTFGPGGTGFGALGADGIAGRTVLVRANGKMLVGGGSTSIGGAVSQWEADGCLQATKPKLQLSGLASSKWQVKAGGTLQVPGLTAFDPSTDGVRVQLHGRNNATLTFGGFTLPGGAGWSRNGSGTSWKYKGIAGAPGGVTALKLTKKVGTPTPLKFSLKTKAHMYYADSDYFPLSFEVDLDVAASPHVECSVGTFFKGLCDEKLASDGRTSGDLCK